MAKLDKGNHRSAAAACKLQENHEIYKNYLSRRSSSRSFAHLWASSPACNYSYSWQSSTKNLWVFVMWQHSERSKVCYAFCCLYAAYACLCLSSTPCVCETNLRIIKYKLYTTVFVFAVCCCSCWQQAMGVNILNKNAGRPALCMRHVSRDCKLSLCRSCKSWIEGKQGRGNAASQKQLLLFWQAHKEKVIIYALQQTTTASAATATATATTVSASRCCPRRVVAAAAAVAVVVVVLVVIVSVGVASTAIYLSVKKMN